DSAPLVVSTFADTAALVTGAQDIAANTAIANFESSPDGPAVAEGEISSTIDTDDDSFSGIANSVASASGLFLVNPGETFSFDFSFQLALDTSIDNPQKESASALGELGLFLSAKPFEPGDLDLDNPDPQELENIFLSDVGFNALDSLQLIAELNTVGDEPDPQALATDGFSGSDLVGGLTLGGLSEEILFDIQGTYSQTFNEATFIKLNGAVLTGHASAQAVPAPSVLWGVLILGGGLLAGYRTTPSRF
ncbi:MAG: hypothetical protein SWJ54_13750, partial [Cyanobacteriota bacterium]|nr:hypothetical protein [Cyanobacteriota bacterium]